MKIVQSCLLICLMLTTGSFLFAAGQADQAKKEGAKNLEASLKVDTSGLKSEDGQSLLIMQTKQKVIPDRPADPDALPEDDPLHWWDMEFAGWKVEKENIPESPADGAIGKSVILIVHGDHPWTTACINGAQKVADAYQIDLKVLSPNWDLAVQNQMIDQAINERPDLIIIFALDAKTAPQQGRRINQAGIPLLFSNMSVTNDAHKYCIAWTGPDDFGQLRKLSRMWADKLGKKGGVAYIQHAPGGSPYYARCWGPISELSVYAPDIYTLDKQAPGFEAERTMQLVSDWITRFGDELKGICAADDSAQALGIIEALEKAGRKDIIAIAAGNSKIGMDLVKDGSLYAITYQTAEGDGALAIQTAADWFNGLEIAPVRYLPQHMITIKDVDEYYPPQW